VCQTAADCPDCYSCELTPDNVAPQNGGGTCVPAPETCPPPNNGGGSGGSSYGVSQKCGVPCDKKHDCEAEGVSCFTTPNCAQYGKDYICARYTMGNTEKCKCVPPKGKAPALLPGKTPVPTKLATLAPLVRPPSRSPAGSIEERPQVEIREETNGVRQGTGQAVAINPLKQFVNIGNLPLIIAGIVLSGLLFALVIWHNKHKPKHRR